METQAHQSNSVWISSLVVLLSLLFSLLFAEDETSKLHSVGLFLLPLILLVGGRKAVFKHFHWFVLQSLLVCGMYQYHGRGITEVASGVVGINLIASVARALLEALAASLNAHTPGPGHSPPSGKQAGAKGLLLDRLADTGTEAAGVCAPESKHRLHQRLLQAGFLAADNALEGAAVLRQKAVYSAKGTRVQAVVKIHSHKITPSMLQDNAVSRFGALLAARGTRALPLGGAVRYGCVLLTMDLYKQQQLLQWQAIGDESLEEHLAACTAQWLQEAQLQGVLDDDMVLTIQLDDRFHHFKWNEDHVLVPIASPESIQAVDSPHCISPCCRVLLLPKIAATANMDAPHKHNELQPTSCQLNVAISLRPGERLVGWEGDASQHEARAEQAVPGARDEAVCLVARYMDAPVPVSILHAEADMSRGGSTEPLQGCQALRATLVVQLPLSASPPPSVLLLELWSAHVLLTTACEVLLMPSHMSAVRAELLACLHAEQLQAGRSEQGSGADASNSSATAAASREQGSRRGAAAFVLDLGVWLGHKAQGSARPLRASLEEGLPSCHLPPRCPTQSTLTSSSRSSSASITLAAPPTTLSKSQLLCGKMLARSSSVGSSGSRAAAMAAAAAAVPSSPRLPTPSQQLGKVYVGEDPEGERRLSQAESFGSVPSAGGPCCEEHSPKLGSLQALGIHLLSQAVMWGLCDTAEAVLQGLMEGPCSLPFHCFANGVRTSACASAADLADAADNNDEEDAEQVDSLLSCALCSGSPRMLAVVLRWGQVHCLPGTHVIWDWHAPDAQGITPLCHAQAAMRSQPAMMELLLGDEYAGPGLLAAWLEQLPPPSGQSSLMQRSQACLQAGLRSATYFLLLLCCSACGFTDRQSRLVRATLRARTHMQAHGCCSRSSGTRSTSTSTSTSSRDDANTAAGQLEPIGEGVREACYRAWLGPAMAPTVELVSGTCLGIYIVVFLKGMVKVGFVAQLQHLPVYGSGCLLELVRGWVARRNQQHCQTMATVINLFMLVLYIGFGLGYIPPTPSCILVMSFYGEGLFQLVNAVVDLVPFFWLLSIRSAFVVAAIPLYNRLGMSKNSQIRSIITQAIALAVSFLSDSRFRHIFISQRLATGVPNE